MAKRKEWSLPRWAAVVWVLLGLPVLAASGLFLWFCFELSGPPAPTDAQLIRNFQENRPALDCLVRMLQRDPKIDSFHLGKHGGRQEALQRGMSLRRFAVYDLLMQSAGLQYGFYRNPDGLLFITFEDGWLLSDSRIRGYAYCPVPPPQKPYSRPAAYDETRYTYCHLTGCWYLLDGHLPGS